MVTTANDSPNLAHRHLMMSSDLEKRNHIENNAWLPVDMEFLFYRVKDSKRNSISTSHHVLYCLSYKHNSPLLGRKDDFINE